MSFRLFEQALIGFCLALTFAALVVAMNAPEWYEALLIHDAGNDILPDWLWDAGVPSVEKKA